MASCLTGLLAGYEIIAAAAAVAAVAGQRLWCALLGLWFTLVSAGSICWLDCWIAGSLGCWLADFAGSLDSSEISTAVVVLLCLV